MTLEEAYLLSQIISAVAVVGSVIYLAVQVQRNTVAVRLNTGHSVSAEMRASLALVAQNDTLADIVFRGGQVKGPDTSLSRRSKRE